MRILHLSIIITLFVLTLILPQTAYAKKVINDILDNANIDHFDAPNKYFPYDYTNMDFNKTEFTSHGVTLQLNQIPNKTIAKDWEHVDFHFELTSNNGSMVLTYDGFNTYIINDVTGDTVEHYLQPPSHTCLLIPGPFCFGPLNNDITLKSNVSIATNATLGKLFSNFLFQSGNYTEISGMFFHTKQIDDENITESGYVWSRPAHIILLSKNDAPTNQTESYLTFHTVPEFPFAIPILLISIVLTIVFYRIKFEK